MAVLLAFFTLVAFVGRASAADVPALTGYTVSSWSGSDGVALGAVRALAQDRHGYIWLGTDSGLYRFDGVHFAPGDSLTSPSLPRLPVRALLVDTRQRLWIGLADEGGLYVLDGNRLQRASAPGDVTGTVNSLAQGADGGIWVAHDRGVVHLQERAGATFTHVSGLPQRPAYHVRTHRAAVYVATATGLFVRESKDAGFVRDTAALAFQTVCPMGKEF